MLQMVRLGDQYINLAHVLGVTFGDYALDYEDGEHEVPLATVEMAAQGPAAEDEPVTYRFYGATALALRAWLDERTTVIAEEAEKPPAPVWSMDPLEPWDGCYEGEDAPAHEADPVVFDSTFQGLADLPY